MAETARTHNMTYTKMHRTGGQWRFSPMERYDVEQSVERTQGLQRRSIPGTIPYVTVKKQPDGKYVVIEKYPRKLKPVAPVTHDHSPWKLMKLKNSSEVKFRSVRPEWKYSVSAGRLTDKPESDDLPDCDLSWNATAKVGSLENYYHQPGGGHKRIFSKKVAWNASSKIGSLDNMSYPVRNWRSQSDPLSQKYLSNSSPHKLKPMYGAAASVGMFDHVHYTPGGAVIVKSKKNFDHVKSKIGSLDSIDHAPQGGNKKIPNFKCRWISKSRVGSLENVHHNPAGGDVLFLQEKLNWNKKSKIGSLENITHNPGGGHVKIENHKTVWRSGPRIGSLDNVHHTPGGGNYVIPTKIVKWKAKPKVDSLPGKRKEKYYSPVNLDDYLDEYELDN